MILAPPLLTRDSGFRVQSPRLRLSSVRFPPAIVHDTTCLTDVRPPLDNIGPQNIDRRRPADSCQRRLEKDAKTPHAAGLRRATTSFLGLTTIGPPGLTGYPATCRFPITDKTTPLGKGYSIGFSVCSCNHLCLTRWVSRCIRNRSGQFCIFHAGYHQQTRQCASCRVEISGL
jgi:hypothetical protein